MDIRVFDKALNALGVIDEMSALIWTCRYFKVGEFKLLAPITASNKELLVVGNIISKHDQYIDFADSSGNIWRRAAEITYVHYTKDERGQEQIEARGYMLSRWLSQRVINPQIQLNGNCQAIVNQLIMKNIGASAPARRKFPQFITLPQGNYGGISIAYSNEALKDLGDEVRDVCQSGKLGYDILICERTKQYGFYLYQGNDYTADNTAGNPPCIFSRDFDNVNEQDFEDSTDNVKNYAFVRGATDQDERQEVATVDRAAASGLALYEVLVDASDISRDAENGSGELVPIPAAQYTAMLISRGNTELDNMIENYTFNSSINVLSNLTYKKDFDLGDRVTCVEKQWGLTINSRITEITQTYEKGKALIEATFGESAPTLLDKIKRL